MPLPTAPTKPATLLELTEELRARPVRGKAPKAMPESDGYGTEAVAEPQMRQSIDAAATVTSASPVRPARLRRTASAPAALLVAPILPSAVPATAVQPVVQQAVQPATRERGCPFISIECARLS